MTTTVKPIAFLLVGIPGAAQADWKDCLPRFYNFVSIAPDALITSDAPVRKATFGDIVSSNMNIAATWINDKVKELIDVYRNFVWDQANLTLTARRPKIDLLIAAGYDVVAVAFEIPGSVTGELGKEYVRPTRLEGFSKIIIVTPTEEYVAEA